MSILMDGHEKKTGLALSGEGFRATAFHLGAFRKLDELGLLFEIDLLTCVGGGSIAGGFLASRWNQPDVLDQLQKYLSTKSIAVSSALGRMLDPLLEVLIRHAGALLEHRIKKYAPELI